MKPSVTEMFWRNSPDEIQENRLLDAYNEYYTKKQISIAKNPNKPTTKLVSSFVAQVKEIFENGD